MDTKDKFANLDDYIAAHEQFVTACRNGDLETAQFLFEQGNIDEDYDAGKALRWAAFKGQLAIVKYLLEVCDTDHTLDDHKATHWAASGGDVATFKYMTSRGGDPASENSCSLYFAAEKGHLEIVKLCINEYNCDPAVYNYCAHRFALAAGFIEVANYLEPFGVSTNQ